MSDKYRRQVRRSVARLKKDAHDEIRAYVAGLRWRARFRLAINILFKKKFGF